MNVNLNLVYNNIPMSHTGKVQNPSYRPKLQKDIVAFTKTKELSKEEKIANFIKKLRKPVQEADNVELLRTAGMLEKYDPIHDVIVLNHYNQPNKDVRWSDLGVDENNFFKQVAVIDGSASFRESNVTNLGRLEIINGDADFMESPLKDLGNLRYVGGTIDCRFSKIEDLRNLEYVGKDAYFVSSPIEDMGNIKKVGGRAVLNGLEEYYDYEGMSFTKKIFKALSKLVK